LLFSLTPHPNVSVSEASPLRYSFPSVLLIY
jgi:hypothetical protein